MKWETLLLNDPTRQNCAKTVRSKSCEPVASSLLKHRFRDKAATDSTKPNRTQMSALDTLGNREALQGGWGVPVPLRETCLYGSHMGLPYGTHMGSATGFGMGPIWVSPYAGCPDGSQITVP